MKEKFAIVTSFVAASAGACIPTVRPRAISVTRLRKRLIGTRSPAKPKLSRHEVSTSKKEDRTGRMALLSNGRATKPTYSWTETAVNVEMH